jgi:hypothetical protein
LVTLWAGCQLPPDHIVSSPDLAIGTSVVLLADDLAEPPDPAPDLAGSDLSLPALPGNQLVVANGPIASILFNVTDDETGLPVPARVIFRPPPGAGFCDDIASGTWNANTSNSPIGAVVADGVLGSPESVLLVTGIGRVPVPPGHYELFITRGPEYEAVDLQLDIKDGDVRRVDAQLDRSVDTLGWLAADLHVHTRNSFDSKIPLDRRVISMVSNGIELNVTTDHNVASDLSPAIAALDYGDDVVGSIIGDEFNFISGHGGAYPVTYDPNLPEGGIPTWQDPCVPGVGVNCTSASDVFAMMHAQYPGTTAVTINHPYWANGDLGYFTNIAWGAGTANPLPAALPTAGLFDAIEVLNGYQMRSAVVGYLISDWMFLLSQGYRVTALGSSDTHKINWVRAGWPRSWLRLPTDRPGEVTGAQLGEAIRHQRAVASTGPFAELTVDGVGIGDTVTPDGETVTVKMRVDAPDWMPLDKVRLYQDGRLLRDWVPPAGRRPVFHAKIEVPVSADSWFVLQAEGSQPIPADVVGEYSHSSGYEVLPFVITNPVFVDADGDGNWHPPAWKRVPPPFDEVREHPPRGSDGFAVPEGCLPGETEPPLDAQGMAERFLASILSP